MSHWRQRSVWWMPGLRVVVMALLLGAPTGWAQEAEDPCEGFSGACYGQCRAALAQGCFENPDTSQCDQREAQWNHHDCPGTPPWVCPCEGETFMGVTWSDAFEVDSCDIPAAGTGARVDGVTPPQQLRVVTRDTGAVECRIVAGSGDALTRRVLIDTAERAACIASLRRIAANDGVECED